MKYIMACLALLITNSVISQINTSFPEVRENIVTSEKSDCDYYRDIIDSNISSLDLNKSMINMIKGKDNEYFDIGLSGHFTSEPKVPDYIYTSENLNMKMVDIIKAHVDLYHCDLEELRYQNTDSELNYPSENKGESDIYPNPTTGLVSIKGNKNEIQQVLIFDMQGQLIQRIKPMHKYEISLANLLDGAYYLYIFSAGDIYKEKVLKM